MTLPSYLKPVEKARLISVVLDSSKEARAASVPGCAWQAQASRFLSKTLTDTTVLASSGVGRVAVPPSYGYCVVWVCPVFGVIT